MKDLTVVNSVDFIVTKILILRGEKILLDVDLADLYGVETKYLKRQVRRNLERFPEDFMFQLTRDENNSLRSHFGTLNRGQHANTPCPP